MEYGSLWRREQAQSRLIISEEYCRPLWCKSVLSLGATRGSRSVQRGGAELAPGGDGQRAREGAHGGRTIPLLLLFLCAPYDETPSSKFLEVVPSVPTPCSLTHTVGLPCQVPRFRLPFVIGMDMDDPISDAFV